MCENTSCYIILDQRGCDHGDASFHHDIVSECLWPSSILVQVLERSKVVAVMMAQYTANAQLSRVYRVMSRVTCDRVPPSGTKIKRGPGVEARYPP